MAPKIPGVRVRFAPSPTGSLHLGGARTALFNYLFARHHSGKFIVRIEDTDRVRSTKASEDEIFETMAWLNLQSDEPVVRQTERMERYSIMAATLMERNQAYHCFCSAETLQTEREAAEAKGGAHRYRGTCRELNRNPDPGESSCIRLKIPAGAVVEIQDLVRGKVTFSSDDLDDWILVRSDGSPTYNFTVVVDDSDMAITHVIRGDDHLSNTPKQVLCYRALEVPTPVFAHVSMILGPDKARLSKRHGATSVRSFREQGFLAAGMLNYLARLGWSYKDQEIFDVGQMVELFDLDSVNPAAAVLDPEKMFWVNAQHLKGLSDDDLIAAITDYIQFQQQSSPGLWSNLIDSPAAARRVLVGHKTRSRTLKELVEMALPYLSPVVEFDPALRELVRTPEAISLLKEIAAWLDARPDVQAAKVEPEFRSWCEQKGQKLGPVAQILRVALTGKKTSPPIFDVIEMLGKERTLERLAAAATLTGPLEKN